MCYNVEMTVTLKEDAGTSVLLLPKPSAFPLRDSSEAKLHLRGDFPHYYVTNLCCGCGAIEGPPDGPGRLLPTRFVGELLRVFPVGSVKLLWWWGGQDDKPCDPPQRRVTWSEFVRLNDLLQLESRTAYFIREKPTRSDPIRRW